MTTTDDAAMQALEWVISARNREVEANGLCSDPPMWWMSKLFGALYGMLTADSIVEMQEYAIKISSQALQFVECLERGECETDELED